MNASMKARPVAVVAACLALAPAPAARADDGVRACIAASTEGQTLRDQGRLLAAREQMLLCARDACPSIVRSHCAKWLTDIDARTPSVVVRAERAEGSDALDARLSIDGNDEPLDGQPVRLDPGRHSILVEDSRGARDEQGVLLVEGEGVRKVLLHLPAAAASDAPPEEHRVPSGAWVLGGVGVAALGAATYFGLAAKNQLDELDQSCAPHCADAQTHAGRTDALAFDVLLGAGIGAVAGALLWGLFFPTGAPSGLRAARAFVQPSAFGATTTLGFAW